MLDSAFIIFSGLILEKYYSKLFLRFFPFYKFKIPIVNAHLLLYRKKNDQLVDQKGDSL